MGRIDDRRRRRVTAYRRLRSGNSSVASPSCNTLSTIICIPPLSQQIAAKTRFTRRVRTHRVHIYIYKIYIIYIYKAGDGGRGEEGRGYSSLLHRRDLILLGQNLFGFLCARCDASRRNQLFISLFYLFNVRLINARTESRAAPRCKS